MKFRGVVAGLGLVGMTGLSGTAFAQASSMCTFVNNRMVDAIPLVGQKKQTEETTGNLHYLLYKPNGHDPTKKWPVIVFMHGSGENNAAGDTLNNLTKHSLPRLVEDPTWNYPFIVVSPQIGGGGWDQHAQEIAAVLDRVEDEFGGDPNREYLTGLSYGGVGTYTVGMALADRIAALMPVTPGGGLAGWDMRTKLVNLPIWLNVGTTDSEYQVNSTRVTELEASGAETFFKYTYAFADEYNDVVPKEALTHKHVFGSYTAIGHDVWHATYGVYCPDFDKKKTTQYEWLLSQSKDGSAFVDPRDPNAGTGGSGGASAGGSGGAAAGAAGAAGSAASTAGAGGAPGAAGSAATQAGSAGSLPVSPVAGSGGTGSGGAPAAPAAATQDDSSCSFSAAPEGARGAWLLLGAAALLGRRRRASR